MPHGGQNIAKVGSGELRDIEDCILVTEADYSTASDLFEKGEIEEIRTKLLAWYDKNRRKLPWRGDNPPYGKEIVKKEGMPVHNFPSDRGDLVANFIIDMPKELTAEQKAVIAEVF